MLDPRDDGVFVKRLASFQDDPESYTDILEPRTLSEHSALGAQVHAKCNVVEDDSPDPSQVGLNARSTGLTVGLEECYYLWHYITGGSVFQIATPSTVLSCRGWIACTDRSWLRGVSFIQIAPC